jgi:hypothetical protein
MSDQPKLTESSPTPSRRVKDRLDHAAVADICAQYQAGVDPSELATTYGLAKNRVAQLLIREGIPIRHRNTGLSPTQTAEATRLYLAGMSLVQVGQELGFSQSSAYDVIKRTNVPMLSALEVGRQLKLTRDE